MTTRYASLIIALFYITGCSTFGSKNDEQTPPAKLEPFSEQVQLVREWRASSGKITKNNKQIQPILVDTTLYTASSAGVVTAFDAETGKNVWSRKLKLTLSAGIGYGDGLLLAGTEEGEVVALYMFNTE